MSDHAVPTKPQIITWISTWRKYSRAGPRGRRGIRIRPAGARALGTRRGLPGSPPPHGPAAARRGEPLGGSLAPPQEPLRPHEDGDDEDDEGDHVGVLGVEEDPADRDHLAQ